MSRKYLLSFLFSVVWIALGAQGLTRDDVEIDTAASPYPGQLVVTRIKSNRTDPVKVNLTDERGEAVYTFQLDKKSSFERKGSYICNAVVAKIDDGKDNFIVLLKKSKPKVEHTPAPVVTATPQSDVPSSQPTGGNGVTPVAVIRPIPKNGPIGIDEIIQDFTQYVDSIPFYSIAALEVETAEIDGHIVNLRNWKDKGEYVRTHHLNTYINANGDSIELYKGKTASLINEYMGKFGNREIADKSECVDSIQSIITDRIGRRRANLDRLSAEINDTPRPESFDWENLDWKYIGIGLGLALLLIAIFASTRKAIKKSRVTSLTGSAGNASAAASSDIVILRKTNSILRKQSLEDVVGNESYLKIDCSEFCSDSAVRWMYVKNTCIKDIYNMYAEDLRNTSKPNEDGCMVLGRWVYDPGSNSYSVSLEQIVLPGDDAVFAEYELNFGGKIKLMVTEKLRRLRKETNLQYDLTCWVHSHPGLGVFFSNSDVNVHMQEKHPAHPNFLTAIVVDILTPRQELGIFTFRHDSSINSKEDLKKMYSLEDWYKWAVESDRSAFKAEDYYNALANARAHRNDCHGIELSNGAIIDMGMLAAERNAGLVVKVFGFSNQRGQNVEHVAVTATDNEAVPDNELIGCFIIATYCSIPSIRKAISGYLEKIKFVIVYTTSDDLLTSIPVVNNDVCDDESYYGEQKLEELKTWTRRKR